MASEADVLKPDERDLPGGAAASQLERLALEARETVAIGTFDNDQILYIDQRSQGGPFGFRIEIGRRAPLHGTAVGKALLAFSTPHEQRAILHRILAEAPFSGGILAARLETAGRPPHLFAG